MTTTRQHIEDLEPTKWAGLTRAAAAESIETSRRLGLEPRPETIALAAQTEAELVEHRSKGGPAEKRLSMVMQLVAADQRSREAQRLAREAHQGRLDAEATATIARADADESARVAQKARERARAVQADSAKKDRERAREHAADQHAVQLARDETEQVRADSAAEMAAAQERARAAEERAEQRTNERTAERLAAETKLQELQAQLDTLRADSAAEVAAARERVRAAEERAEQRMAERAADRAAAEEAAARLRAEVNRVRADAAAEIAAARGQARAEVDNARRYAEDTLRQAREVAAATPTPASGLLTIPIAPVQVRPQIGPIEAAVDALYRIDYLLETGLAPEQPPVDINHLRSLTQTVQEHARKLASELENLPRRFANQTDVDAAASYANAAGSAYTVLLQRIEQATERLRSRNVDQAVEIAEAISTMVADPWIRALCQPIG